MSDNWRVKRYYDHRVLVPTADVLENTYPDIWLCLTAGQAALIRRLLTYATWHSTFVSQYEQAFYLCPTNEEWDQIQALVADLEEKLMPCNDLADAINNIASALQCICAALPESGTTVNVYTPLTPGIIDGYYDDGTLIPGDPYAGGEVVVDVDRCATANLAWQFAWEILTERLQPTQDATLEALIPGITAFIAFIIGGPVLGIPVASIAVFVTQLISVWVDAEQANISNAYFAYRDELVCAVYTGLATSTQAAQAAVAVVIDGMTELSPIDKALMKTSFAPWILHFIGVAWDAQTEWAQAYSEGVACDGCGVIEGTDWYARAWGAGCTINHIAEAEPYELTCTVSYSGMQDGERLIGVVWSTVRTGGNNDMGGPNSDVGACRTLTGAQYITDPAQTFFGYKRYEDFDPEECEAALCPGADTYFVDNVLEDEGEVCFGWAVTGAAAATLTATVEYLVFLK